MRIEELLASLNSLNGQHERVIEEKMHVEEEVSVLRESYLEVR